MKKQYFHILFITADLWYFKVMTGIVTFNFTVSRRMAVYTK